MESNLVLVRLSTKYLMDSPVLFQKLCDTYCSIWETDEHFGEYRKCSQCERYFSQAVVNAGLSVCDSCQGLLVKAWEPVPVALRLLDISKHFSFSGVMLMDDNQVVGFSWGRLYTTQEMSARWGLASQSLLSLNVGATRCFFLEELGICRELRGKGWGKKLVMDVLSNPISKYPQALGALSTHTNSDSVYIYRKLGYQKIADHPAGQNRICMGINKVGNIQKPEIQVK